MINTVKPKHDSFLAETLPIAKQRASTADIPLFHRAVIAAMEYKASAPPTPTDRASANVLKSASESRSKKADMYKALEQRVKDYTLASDYSDYQGRIVQAMKDAYTVQSTMTDLQSGLASHYLAMYDADDKGDSAASLKASTEAADYVLKMETTLPTIVDKYDKALKSYNSAILDLSNKMINNKYYGSLTEKISKDKATAKDIIAQLQ